MFTKTIKTIGSNLLLINIRDALFINHNELTHMINIKGGCELFFKNGKSTEIALSVVEIADIINDAVIKNNNKIKEINENQKGD